MADVQKTQKQLYQHIAEVMADDAEVVAFCEKKIKQIDKRKTTLRKTPAEVLERREDVRAYLAIHPYSTVKQIAGALGYTSPQVTGAIRGLAGEVEAHEGEKKSAPKTYVLVTADADVD